MGKFVYPVANINGQIELETVFAVSYEAAKNKIFEEYYNKYEDLQESEWEEFLDEIYNTHGIIIGDPTDIELL